MKKLLLILLIITFSASMVFMGIGCKAATEETTATATTETEAAVEGTTEQYHFVSILWSTADPNIGWITKPAEDYMVLNSNVVIDSVGPAEYDAAGHLEFLETAIANEVDGIYMHVSDPTVLAPAFEEAAAAGIPIVTHTGRFDTSILPENLWLANVGWDELKMGSEPAKYLIENYDTPKHVVATLAHLGHAGQELRCQGFEQELPDGVEFEKLPIGDDPTAAKEILTAFFTANPDVEVVFNTNSLSEAWTVGALEELGMAENIIQIGTSDSPADIEGILQGKITFTNGIQFYLNGWYPPHVLYTYLKTGLPGPKYLEQSIVIVNKDTAQAAKDMIISITGQQAYDDANPWK